MAVDTATKNHSRRRVYFFVAIWIVIALIGLINEESDKFFNVLDDYGIIGVAIVALIYLWTQRKKTSEKDFKMQRNVLTILFLIALAFQIYAIPTELSDAQDFGNEIPVLIMIILTLLNGFF